MAQVIWTDSALKDLEAIVRYIAKDSAVYARRTGAQLFAAAKQLRSLPRIGRVVPELSDPDIREIIQGSYRIVYQLRGDDCFIIAIIHASRDMLNHFPQDRP